MIVVKFYVSMMIYPVYLNLDIRTVCVDFYLLIDIIYGFDLLLYHELRFVDLVRTTSISVQVQIIRTASMYIGTYNVFVVFKITPVHFC